ncbi:MAG: fluoride efflux transporter CrcB [Candidatus Gastranaerophilales bacterium]|nr:fluoride efflux transporter CrcB [Candidatus Gastranaerophilales bacterium]
MQFLMIFLGGGLGSCLRFGTSLMCNKVFDAHFLVATLLVNILGSLALGFLSGLFMAKTGFLNPNSRLFLTVGFCGGFTTFSTFSMEGFELLKNGQTTLAAGYMLLSVILCLLAVFLGYVGAKYV